MTEKTIYQVMKENGIRCESHESDLYVPVCVETVQILREYRYCGNVTRFHNQVDGGDWFDIPFAYDPYWQHKAERES